ncbi:MAG: STAS domain-containing protein [Desulfarculus sp.]|nr:STAS domain-containing protein [Desulfarculus sp.]
MDYRYSSQGDLARVAIAGRIEAQDAPRLKEPFQRLREEGLRRVELDFAGVAYIGSAGLAVLMQMHKLLSTQGGAIRIVNCPAAIASLLRSLKLDRLFNL